MSASKFSTTEYYEEVEYYRKTSSPRKNRLLSGTDRRFAEHDLQDTSYIDYPNNSRPNSARIAPDPYSSSWTPRPAPDSQFFNVDRRSGTQESRIYDSRPIRPNFDTSYETYYRQPYNPEELTYRYSNRPVYCPGYYNEDYGRTPTIPAFYSTRGRVDLNESGTENSIYKKYSRSRSLPPSNFRQPESWKAHETMNKNFYQNHSPKFLTSENHSAPRFPYSRISNFYYESPKCYPHYSSGQSRDLSLPITTRYSCLNCYDGLLGGFCETCGKFGRESSQSVQCHPDPSKIEPFRNYDKNEYTDSR
ncbi:unnamed protein product, partial [Mesorhabditis belari]|uniref:Uncharacterized protein n=1 Tax=Mesorhabditis belari TaxID=2138241 RepID=A0AAF3FRI5_9BILA